MKFTPEQKQRIDVLIEKRLLQERRRVAGEHERQIAELRAELDRLRQQRDLGAWLRRGLRRITTWPGRTS